MWTRRYAAGVECKCTTSNRTFTTTAPRNKGKQLSIVMDVCEKHQGVLKNKNDNRRRLITIVSELPEIHARTHLRQHQQ
jgi:hypothetical protein